MNKKQIKERIQQILNNSVFTDRTATIYVNAPKALIQYGLEIELHTLQDVVGLKRTDVKQLRGEK